MYRVTLLNFAHIVTTILYSRLLYIHVHSACRMYILTDMAFGVCESV